MQLAINLIIFVLGFACAGVVGTNPKQTRATLDNLLSKLRFVLDAFRPAAPPTAEHLQKQLAIQEDVELLTRFVA